MRGTGISERTGATIVLISQKNKAGFTSRGLQTIKGSVDIVYLADVVMFLESDEEKTNKDNGKDLDSIIATFGGQVLKTHLAQYSLILMASIAVLL